MTSTAGDYLCERLAGWGAGFWPARQLPAESDLQAAADLLNAGRKVAMLVSAGALHATDAVIAVADTLGAGVAKTLLALDMNGAPLPAEHGAPLRLRIESQLGFKMVKWIAAIEFTDDIAGLGVGQGGWREDQQSYASAAGI